jgi:hypothetical protein
VQQQVGLTAVLLDQQLLAAVQRSKQDMSSAAAARSPASKGQWQCIHPFTGGSWRCSSANVAATYQVHSRLLDARPVASAVLVAAAHTAEAAMSQPHRLLFVQ